MVGFTLWGVGLLCTHDVNRWEFLCEIKLFGLVQWAAKKVDTNHKQAVDSLERIK